MLSLKDREWAGFFIEDICEIFSGVRLTKADMVEGDIPFIGASDSNNGITAFVSNRNGSYKAGVLGVNYNGSVVENFYHPYHAVFSDDVKQLRIKNGLESKYTYLFLKSAILQQKSKYAYGYKFNAERMRRQIIMLPVDDVGNPDWDFMLEYMRERETELVKRYRAHIEDRVSLLEKSQRGGVISLTNLEWKEFGVSEIFPHISRGKRLKKADHTPGMVPYASSTEKRNGTDGFCGNETGVRVFDQCLTVANSGSVGACFYHPYKFVASDHVTALKTQKADRHAYLFLSVLLSRLGEKYSFNREISDKRMSREKLYVPIDIEGNPNWSAMSDYGKLIELKVLKAYLEHMNSCDSALTDTGLEALESGEIVCS